MLAAPDGLDIVRRILSEAPEAFDGEAETLVCEVGGARGALER